MKGFTGTLYLWKAGETIHIRCPESTAGHNSIVWHRTRHRCLVELIKLKRTQNAEMIINTHKDSIPLSVKIYSFFLWYFNWRLLHMLHNESFTQRKNGKWWYVPQFAGLRVWGFLFVFGSALATWHRYHFFSWRDRSYKSLLSFEQIS